MMNLRMVSLTQILIENHEQTDNRGKIKGHRPLENVFGFCKTFDKFNENLGFHLKL